jgi:hypothetical protein
MDDEIKQTLEERVAELEKDSHSHKYLEMQKEDVEKGKKKGKLYGDPIVIIE